MACLHNVYTTCCCQTTGIACHMQVADCSQLLHLHLLHRAPQQQSSTNHLLILVPPPLFFFLLSRGFAENQNFAKFAISQETNVLVPVCVCVSVVFGLYYWVPWVLCVCVFQLSLACTTAIGLSWPCSRLCAGLAFFLSRRFSLATVSLAALLQNGKAEVRAGQLHLVT